MIRLRPLDSSGIALPFRIRDVVPILMRTRVHSMTEELWPSFEMPKERNLPTGDEGLEIWASLSNNNCSSGG